MRLHLRGNLSVYITNHVDVGLLSACPPVNISPAEIWWALVSPVRISGFEKTPEPLAQLGNTIHYARFLGLLMHA